jgi:hypothetical protein
VSDFIYGELYLPLTVDAVPAPITFSYSWSVPAGMTEVLAGYAGRFGAPFWRTYHQDTPSNRSYSLPDGTSIVETLVEQSGSGYSYDVAGFPASAYHCAFTIASSGDDSPVSVTWTVTFTADNPASAVTVLRAATSDAASMLAALGAYVAPNPAS